MIRDVQHLICEGVCNPIVKRVDARVREFRRASNGLGPISLPEELLRDLHSLRHTPHTRLTSGRFACRECQTIRTAI